MIAESMPKTLYNLIKNNRNNATQKTSIAMTQHFPKRVGKNNEQTVYDNKYHYSNPLTLYPNKKVAVLTPQNLLIIFTLNFMKQTQLV